MDTTEASLWVLFGVYLLFLTWIVLWKLNLPYAGQERAVKLVPFIATSTAGANAGGEILANLVLFVPFGLYVGALTSKGSRAIATLPLAAATSLALETGQYVLSVGRSDITDVIVNTAGAVLGLGLATLARYALRAKAARFLTRLCTVGTVTGLLAVGAYMASPEQPIHTHDAGPLAATQSKCPNNP